MKYEKVCCGKFIKRHNRFLADVEMSGRIFKVHVKNTGRCRELLVPGAEVFLEDFDAKMGTRKLRYSLIGVRKNISKYSVIVNMDSQAPNKVVREALESGRLVLPSMDKTEYVKGEYSYGNSRLDFYVKDSKGRKALVEVKGVTLENNGVAMFPDAPTQRGVKHIKELIKAADDGYRSYVIFVIQMKGVDMFISNDKTHEDFGQVLRLADTAGVRILAYDCVTGEDFLWLDEPVAVKL